VLKSLTLSVAKKQFKELFILYVRNPSNKSQKYLPKLEYVNNEDHEQ
jgi:hypothetical protein